MPLVSTDGIMAVRIGEDLGRKALLVDGIVQSISPEDGVQVGGYWAAMVPREVRPKRALILGLGGGTLAQLLRARWGDVEMVGVDDDPAVIATASSIGWLPLGGLDIEIGDAFAFVQSCRRRFDYVAIDLFRGERLARRAFGQPFLKGVRELLDSRGWVVVNMFDDAQATDRIERIATLFAVQRREIVGGNIVLHARRRR
ncbi:MAG: hypothetical protein NVSMB2_29000 [Chloroflexota bacterium]